MTLGILKTALIYFIQFYCISLLILYIFQRNVLYYPTPYVPHDYKSENFTIEGEDINVIKINEKKENAIIYFGGNVEAVVLNAATFKEIFPKHAIYLVNYRGYGESTGDPSEKAFYSDALYIYDALKKRHSNISVIGRSLGSAMATHLAAHRPIHKMILTTPYDSILQIAQDRFYIYPISVLLKDKYDSKSNVKNISSKTLILLAQHDKIIPLKYPLSLIKEFPKEQVIIETILNVDHNFIVDSKQYQKSMSDFMSEQ